MCQHDVRIAWILQCQSTSVALYNYNLSTNHYLVVRATWSYLTYYPW